METKDALLRLWLSGREPGSHIGKSRVPSVPSSVTGVVRNNPECHLLSLVSRELGWFSVIYVLDNGSCLERMNQLCKYFFSSFLSPGKNSRKRKQ